VQDDAAEDLNKSLEVYCSRRDIFVFGATLKLRVCLRMLSGRIDKAEYLQVRRIVTSWSKNDLHFFFGKVRIKVSCLYVDRPESAGIGQMPMGSLQPGIFGLVEIKLFYIADSEGNSMFHHSK